jgi:hypothetical protein
VIQRTCLTDKNPEYPNSDLVRELTESKNTVQKIDNMFYAHIIENIELRDTVSIVVGIAEMIEEKQIVEVFRKLQKVNGYGMPKRSTIPEINLGNSLNHYEIAMSEFSRLFKFKNLFNTLELVVNIDGKNRKGPDFDAEAISLDPKNGVDVKKWREFYNRIKHAQRDRDDITAYEKGEEDLPRELEYSRGAVQKILLSKLNSPLA